VEGLSPPRPLTLTTNLHPLGGLYNVLDQTETATENRVCQVGSCRHCSSHSSMASLIAPDQWCVFCTPSLAIFATCCYQLDSNLAKLEETVKVGWILEFLSVMLARVPCIFQLSKRSVEALFRWNRKNLHHFAANSCRKRCTLFHRKRPSFMGDIRLQRPFLLFSGQSVE